MRENIFRTFLRDRNSKTAIIIVSVAAVVIAIGLVYRLFFYAKNNDTESTTDDNMTESLESINDITSINEIHVGEHYTFGTYEQDNNKSNGAEPIEWRVLAVEDGKALLITEKLIDCKKYNDTLTAITWETSTLRKWLNDDFFNKSFSIEEQAKIALVTNQNPDNPSYGTKGGNDTQDKIFVLSIDEEKKYFSSGEDMIIYATPYAKSQGSYADENDGGFYWWLRSPGHDCDNAAVVLLDSGLVDQGGVSVDLIYGSVRPALWLELSF